MMGWSARVPGKPGVGLMGWSAGVPGKPGVGLMGWSAGVPGKPGVGLMGWSAGRRGITVAQARSEASVSEPKDKPWVSGVSDQFNTAVGRSGAEPGPPFAPGVGAMGWDGEATIKTIFMLAWDRLSIMRTPRWILGFRCSLCVRCGECLF